jgi:hypothetical protein
VGISNADGKVGFFPLTFVADVLEMRVLSLKGDLEDTRWNARCDMHEGGLCGLGGVGGDAVELHDYHSHLRLRYEIVERGMLVPTTGMLMKSMPWGGRTPQSSEAERLVATPAS